MPPSTSPATSPPPSRACWPPWTSPVEPGSTHDLTCARLHGFPALHPVAVRGLPVLADKGSPPQAGGTPTAPGAGIRVPARRLRSGRQLDPVTRGWNACINSHRAPVERSVSVLGFRWRALKHATLDPARIGSPAAAALVLTRTEEAHREKLDVG